ncbi:MAG: hypothetical protein A2381_01220 [Bdellovibrionales bacterium RIFOXYB1_FULL_37_110]|nr:MAG: hypothetical protein A2417_02075 [Bdellovibrionales bacterium RIFOXYC1_FULL_37_79]OFZ58839.1 MAG: hypothetical protein A2381_01220 [Bdellovibrionales bacterium RIFOXYB1_FULL_37_110]OFZ64838.1 MAG: hypothetical protein A2577_07220 [Bdellovibrionales bacterium RIFOXYD1_FULL_36_51]
MSKKYISYLPGGNQFDDIRVNLPVSYKIQDDYLTTVLKKNINSNILYNFLKLAILFSLKKIKLWESLVQCGFIKGWFNEFYDYWVNVLNGRPITVFDFHHLYFHYRRKNQESSEMSWENAKDHIHNWQNPNNIGLTFHYVAKYSRLPFRSKELFKYIRKGQQILEYGCALAPMYRTYREYLNHFKCSWVLADIPNFPFHYARYTYAKDAGVIFSTITDEIMDDPLRGIDKKFDLIIIQEVFEHLHSPLHVAKYLNERLRIGGLLFFDYVLSDAKGLDTPMGLAERNETLKHLNDHFQILEGRFSMDIGQTVGFCVGKKIR